MRTQAAFVLSVALAVVYVLPVEAPAQTISDEAGLISIDAPVGWSHVEQGRTEETLRALGNYKLRFVGVEQESAAILFIRTADAVDIIPSIQVSILPITGLTMTDADMEELRTLVESTYSERMGVRFKVLRLERVELNGLRAAEITGIYPYGESNIRVLQYLIPGSGRLYEITYTAREKEYGGYLDAVEEAVQTVSIADAPLIIEGLLDLLRWLALIILVGTAVWLILYLSSQGFGREPPAGKGDSVSPFMRKRYPRA